VQNIKKALGLGGIGNINNCKIFELQSSWLGF